MFPILLRVLTIAGTFTIAAVITRRYLRHAAEEAGQAGASSQAGERKIGSSASGGSASSAGNSANSEQNAAKSSSAEPEAASTPANAKSAAVDSTSAPVNTASNPAHPAKVVETAPAKTPETASAKTAAAFAKPTVRKDLSIPGDAAGEPARIMLFSSQQMLEHYKQPQGLSVDLSIANVVLDSAIRSLDKGRFDEAWEKASAVGMLVGMAEIRAAVEKKITETEASEPKSDKLAQAKATLEEADKLLAKSKKFFDDDDSATSLVSSMNTLQIAFQKTTEAQSKL